MANKKKPVANKKNTPPKMPVQGKKSAPSGKTKTARKTVQVKKTAPSGKRATKNREAIEPKERLRRILIAVLAAVIMLGAAVTAVSVRGELLQKKVDLIYSGVLQKEFVTSINLGKDKIRDRVRMTKRHGQTHAFSFFCNETLQLDPANMSGFIVFGNPEGNDCALVLSIEDADGNLLYRSAGIESGKYLSQVRLATDFEPGSTHACKAYVSGYSNRDYSCIGVQYVNLTVEVGGTS